MDDVWKNSSAYGTTLTSDVVLSIEIVSLPVGGTTTRMACGSTMRRSVWPRVNPSADAASLWPSSTDRMPARMISDMYAASLSPRPSSAATALGMRSRVSNVNHPGPNGTPSEIDRYSEPSWAQIVSWTSTGVPRKTQM